MGGDDRFDIPGEVRIDRCGGVSRQERNAREMPQVWKNASPALRIPRARLKFDARGLGRQDCLPHSVRQRLP
jgi:hypothetical protein